MQERPKHYLREWRKHRGFRSIDAAIERAYDLMTDRVIAEGEEGDIKKRGLTQSTLSRIESGKLPYNQAVLEILAEVYRTDPASLIIRDPTDPDGIWSIYDKIPVTERRRALKVIDGVAESFKTGTDG